MKMQTLAAAGLLTAALVYAPVTSSPDVSPKSETRDTSPPAVTQPREEVVEPKDPAPSMAKPAPTPAEKRKLYIYGSERDALAACEEGQVAIAIYTDPENCAPCKRLEADLLAPDMHDWLAAHYRVAVIIDRSGSRIPRTYALLGNRRIGPLVGFSTRKRHTEWMREAHRQLTR